MNITNALIEKYGICILADAYKPSHPVQYPENTTEVCTYLEARKNMMLGKNNPDLPIIFFGMQITMDQYFTKPLTMEQVENSKVFWDKVGMTTFPYELFKVVVTEMGGKLPLEIRCLPEGTVANVHTALYTIKNTDPRFFWLPAYVETIIQQNTWYPTTVASLSWTVKLIQRQFLDDSSDLPVESLYYKLNDFGFRGVTCLEQAMIGGLANSINYIASDTSVANILADEVYNCERSIGDVATHGIPAMEHMTSTAWGKDNEVEAIRNFIETFCCDGGMGSVIADTYNVYDFIKDIIGGELKDLILTKVKESGGCVIVRPDSGDPTIVPIELLTMLEEVFGVEINSKGYKVLPSFIRVIQGDGMNIQSIKSLYDNMRETKWSIDNICIGMGGGLLQQVSRDTLSIAQKGSQITVNGESYGISKDPVTDPGKKSQEGEFDVVEVCGKLVTVNRSSTDLLNDGLLRLIYLDGDVLDYRNFKHIRERAAEGIEKEFAKYKRTSALKAKLGTTQ